MRKLKPYIIIRQYVVTWNLRQSSEEHPVYWDRLQQVVVAKSTRDAIDLVQKLFIGTKTCIKAKLVHESKHVVESQRGYIVVKL